MNILDKQINSELTEFLNFLELTIISLRLKVLFTTYGIRLYSDDLTDNFFCPITAVCFYKTGKYYGEKNFDDAAWRIGLSNNLAIQIVAVVDDINLEEIKLCPIRTKILYVLVKNGVKKPFFLFQ